MGAIPVQIEGVRYVVDDMIATRVTDALGVAVTRTVVLLLHAETQQPKVVRFAPVYARVADDDRDALEAMRASAVARLGASA